MKHGSFFNMLMAESMQAFLKRNYCSLFCNTSYKVHSGDNILWDTFLRTCLKNLWMVNTDHERFRLSKHHYGLVSNYMVSVFPTGNGLLVHDNVHFTVFEFWWSGCKNVILNFRKTPDSLTQRELEYDRTDLGCHGETSFRAKDNHNVISRICVTAAWTSVQSTFGHVTRTYSIHAKEGSSFLESLI